jgi:glycine cleavage system H protein
MDTIMSLLESAAVLIAGLAVRAGFLFTVLVVLAVPVGIVVAAMRGLDVWRRRQLGIAAAGAFSWSDQAFYAPGHTWARPSGKGRVVVGLDDLAQRLFPAPAGLRLPEPGTAVRANEAAAEVRTMGRRAQVVSPVSGKVVAVNAAVNDDPTLVHRDPYGHGWLFTVEPADGTYESLPRGERALTWLKAEGSRLSRFFEMQLGAAAADGGEFIIPPPAMLSDDQWQSLTREFLGNK